jgi:hypothetical protein
MFSVAVFETNANKRIRLSRNDVMMSIVRLVRQYCSDVQTIFAQHNGLVNLDWFANLVYVTPDVRVLDLSLNAVRN